MKNFINFIREQGVIGLAVGFIMGGAVSKLVASLVGDIVNPLLGILLGAAGNLKDASIMVGNARIAWGNFLGTLIDFMTISVVVYMMVRILGLDRLDRKEPSKK